MKHNKETPFNDKQPQERQTQQTMSQGQDKTGVQTFSPVSPAQGVEDVPQETLPKVRGHQVTPIQWQAFELYCSGMSQVEIAKAVGCDRWSIWNWRRQSWWAEMEADFFKAAQRRFQTQLAARSDEILNGLMGVAAGVDKLDRTASARVQAAKLFADVGSDPLVVKKPTVNIQQNTINTGGGDFNVKKMKESDVTPEDLLLIATGKKPPPDEWFD